MNLDRVATYICYIKTYSIVLFTYITALKFLNNNNQKVLNRKSIIDGIILIFISIITENIKYSINIIASFVINWLVIIIMIYKTRKSNLILLAMIVFISMVMNYIIYFIAIIVNFIINKFYIIKSDLENLIVIILFYLLILTKILKLPRLKNGFDFLKRKDNDYIDVIILNISVLILFIIIIFSRNRILEIKSFAWFFIVLCIIWGVTIQKSFELYYKQKLLIKDLDETKEELAKTKEELAKAEKENLEASKRSHSLVHRQKALEFQISELRKSKNSKDINKIKQDVENLSKELYGKEVMTQLSKTNIELIDNMFRYMQFECYKNEIRFDLQICGNIYKMINNVINKETLEILLADHIKNAIIAVKHSENSNKSILVKLGKIDDCYGVCIYDSGIEFKEETLKTLGKKPSSTHLDEGGSGMGFLNTFDTLNKYKASLIIDEIGMPCEENYTKVIMIKFDGKNEFKVNSYRQQKAV